jgi:acetyltransferase-like isoleucine patch superfamily enzyme
MKVKNLRGGGASQIRRYRDLVYGNTSLGHVLLAELLTFFFGAWPGALGILLRSKLYRPLFASVDGKVLIGRNVTFRHYKKIRIGDGVIIDDNAMIDAKGESNTGITLGNNVFIGRGTLVYCKNGDMRLEDGVNVSSSCTLFSSNDLTIGAGTVIGAYSYLLSGGEYDYQDRETAFTDQTGMETRGPLRVGANCWLGARVTILDAASVGDHCVIGAGAVVNRPLPPESLAAGVPARKIKSL